MRTRPVARSICIVWTVRVSTSHRSDVLHLLTAFYDKYSLFGENVLIVSFQFSEHFPKDNKTIKSLVISKVNPCCIRFNESGVSKTNLHFQFVSVSFHISQNFHISFHTCPTAL